MRLAGNTVLITGGGSGIGFAMAQAFLAAGSTVVICGRSQQRLIEAQDKSPALHAIACDVASETDRAAMVDWLTGRFPDLNVLVNNAGIQREIDFTDGVDAFLGGESEIQVNLEAPIILTGMLVPALAGKKHAAVINVSSGLGFVPAVRMPVYSATKAGLHAWSMAIRQQLAPLGIKVFEVVPPAVDTALNSAGRARRGGLKAALDADTFVASVMKDLKAGVPEIGSGMTAGFIGASRADLDRSFEKMNRRK